MKSIELRYVVEQSHYVKNNVNAVNVCICIWAATCRCHTAAVETRKVRHVGRRSERHIGSIVRDRDVPDSIGAAAEAATERKTSKHSSVTQSYFLFQWRLKRWESLTMTERIF